MPVRPCLTCGNLSEQSFCRLHRKAAARGSTRSWRRIREAVLRRDGYRCTAKRNGQRCIEGSRLEVHHIDGNPANNALENLETLCARHHYETRRR